MQRLQGPGFADIPSAARQAALSDARLTADAARWGAELKAAGINANLAPVADVVPADLGDRNAPIGRLDRGYGSSPRTVAAKATAFVRGMDRAGMATAAKHFPGLGRVTRQHRLRPSGGRQPDHPTRPRAGSVRRDCRGRGGHGDGLLGLLRQRSTRIAAPRDSPVVIERHAAGGPRVRRRGDLRRPGGGGDGGL